MGTRDGRFSMWCPTVFRSPKRGFNKGQTGFKKAKGSALALPFAFPLYMGRKLWYTISGTNPQGFARRISVRASSKDLGIPAYALHLFSRPGKNPLGRNCKAPVGERFCDDFCCGQRRHMPICRGGQCKKRAKYPPTGLRVRAAYDILKAEVVTYEQPITG